MKLQIAFDTPDLDRMIQLAQTLSIENDLLEIGTPLLYAHGISAIARFRETFPQATIIADMKIIDRSKEATSLGLQAGADWITVLAGSTKPVIHTACTYAHDMGKKIMLDLIDASSPGQSALEAEALGVDALLFHKPFDDDESHVTFLERWDMVRGNTKLPIFISAAVSRTQMIDVLNLRPHGIVISSTALDLANPQEDIAFLRASLQEASQR